MGYGVNNLYDLLTDIENSLRKNDTTELDMKLSSLSEHKDNILIHITDLGSRTSYMEKARSVSKTRYLT